MTLLRNAKREYELSGICGATSLVGKESYAVKESSGRMVLADDNDNNAEDARIYVLTKGAGVGESV